MKMNVDFLLRNKKFKFLASMDAPGPLSSVIPWILKNSCLLLCLWAFFPAQAQLPEEFECGVNSLLVTPCYVSGDPTNPLSVSKDNPAVVAFGYNSFSTEAPQLSDPPVSKLILASAADVGSVWGIAHQRTSNLVFTSSVLKRHAGYGPLGSGGIYVIEIDEGLDGGGIRTDLSFRLEDLTLTNGGSIQTAPASLSNNDARDLPPDGFIDASDASTFPNIGRASLGDIDITEDEQTLWVVNVYDQTLYEIPIDSPMVSPPTTATAHPVPNPGCDGDGEYRPWAVKVRENMVYVGIVCTSGSRAFVYAYNILTSEWGEEPIITVDLSYERGNLIIGEGARPTRSANWNPWADTWSAMNPPAPSATRMEREFGFPQPILSDIEFTDDNSLILGFLDRGGMQLGNDAISPDPSTGNALYTGDAAGDILIACANVNGNYILERNGELLCSTEDIAGSVAQSPGNDEFFSGDFFEPEQNFVFHDEITLGGIAYLPGSNSIVSTAFDPLDINTIEEDFGFGTDNDFVSRAGGPVWFSLDNGTKERGFFVYTVLDGRSNDTGIDYNFGKAAGLGDLELFCSVEPPAVLCTADPGELRLAGDSIETCFDGESTFDLNATVVTQPTIPQGYSVFYLLSQGSEQVVVNAALTPSFTVAEAGQYGIHTVVYNPDTFDPVVLNETKISDINVVFPDTICGAISTVGVSFNLEPCVVACTTDPGSLTPLPITDSTGNEACYDGENCVDIMAEINTEPVLDSGYTLLYVLTSGTDLVIQETGSEPSFCVADSGRYTIHTLVYDSTSLDLSGIVPGETTGADVLDLIAASDTCAKLDVPGAPFDIPYCTTPPPVCITDAGSLSPVALSDSACFDGDSCVTLTAEVATEPALDSGYTVVYVLTSGEGLIIQGTDGEPSFCVADSGRYTIHTLVYNPETLDLSGIVVGETTGGDVLELIALNDTCAKLDVTGAAFDIPSCDTPPPPPPVCITDAGSLSAIALADSVCFDGDSCVTITAEVVTQATLDSGYVVAYVLTSGDDLVIQGTGEEPTFCVADTGRYTIHTLVYDPAMLDLSGIVPGETTGGDVLELIAINDTCAKLDVTGAAFDIPSCDTPPPPPPVCITDAGSLSAIALADSVCFDGDSCVTITAEVVTQATLDSGYVVAYVLTSGDDLVIQGTGEEPTFCVADTGRYTIHTLVYDPAMLDLSGIVVGETTGGDVLELIAINDTCAKLDVTGAAFDIPSCDTPPPPPPVCITDAGSLSAIALADSICFDGDSCVTITAEVVTQATLDSGYVVAYVLTSGDDLVIQGTGEEPTFCVADTGRYTIHTLVYDPAMLDLSGIVVGETTGGDVLELIAINDTCAKLDVTGAAFDIPSCDTPPPPPPVCITDAGSLSAIALADSICFDGDSCVTITAEVVTQATLDSGYVVAYVLTSGDDLVIQGTGEEPTFCVADTGRYTIHTLVYDPAMLDLSGIVVGETTGGDVLELIAINDTCAKLDVTGAAFDIPSCDTPPPPPVCITDAGSLTPNLDVPVECYDGGDCVEIVANIVDAPVLDSGYSVIYVLTSGEELLIQNVAEEPAFCVDTVGLFTIHTLVYDSTSLDLSAVVLGETTGLDVLGLIAEVDTCAKLDVEGAQFTIEDCGACPRDAQPKAGSLAANPHDCFDLNTGEPIEISAEEVEAPTIPDGYTAVRVLTQGADLTIIAVGDDLSYSVADTGVFTIHTLVYDTLTLNLGLLELGLSTAVDLIELAGDTICFALDVPGAPFEIEECVEDPCIEVDSISAGTLVAVSDTCLEDGTTVKITAEHEDDPIVPEGYSSIYVLTQGEDLVIANVGDMPMFEVSELGTYRIHTLVYDTLTLDLSIVELGVTTAGQVLEVIGDTICAELDVEGAPFEIETCKESPCEETIDIDPGTLTAVMDTCFDGENPVMLVAEHEMDPVIPDGYTSVYVLTQGSDLVIIATDSVPSFKVQGLGLFTIHTLVYDPATLDLGVVEPGVTTGGDVLGILDTVCAALDITGAPFDVKSCTVVDSCENIKDYILTDWWTERPDNPGNHALYLYHSPVDPDQRHLGNRSYQKYIWETEGVYREYFNEDGSMRDTATIKGVVVSWKDSEAKIMIDFKLVNPMNWEDFQAMGGDYKANLWSEETADTAHVNWTYWEISDASKLIGQGSLEGLEFAVQHAPENMRFKLQVGYGANDKDASLGLSGWFLYNGEFEGVSYDAQGDINVDIDTCIEAEICVPIITTSDVDFDIRNFGAKPTFEKNPYVTVNWNAFTSKADRTTFSVDRSVDGGQLFESIEVVDASSAAFSYSVDDYEVELNRPYIYRVRVVIDGNPVTMTQYEEITLEGINSFRLYPNPANGTMFLVSEYPSVGTHTLEMVNAHGQTISTRSLEEIRGEREIDLSNVPAGLYFLKVTAPNGQVELLRFAKY